MVWVGGVAKKGWGRRKEDEEEGRRPRTSWCFGRIFELGKVGKPSRLTGAGEVKRERFTYIQYCVW